MDKEQCVIERRYTGMGRSWRRREKKEQRVGWKRQKDGRKPHEARREKRRIVSA
jgi:hypothetical protein